MPRYSLRVLKHFTDIETGRQVKPCDIVETTSEQRMKNIVKRKLGEVVGVRYDDKHGKRVLVHHTVIFRVGGIETAARQLSKAFPNCDITFCVKNADPAQVMELVKRHSVIIDNGVDIYDTDVLILMNYDSAQNIIKRVTAKKVYQFCHADWQGLMDSGAFKNFKLQIHPRVDKVLAVSETAQRGLKTAFGIDSVIVPNILCKPERERLVFLFMSRATIEKGVDRLLDLVDRFNAAGKDFVVFFCSPLEQAQKAIQDRVKATANIFVLPASPYSQELLRTADYLVQLSNNESYCYSVREALQLGVPIIVSDIPELKKLVVEGKNGFVLDDDFSNLDIDKIFNNVPKPKAYSEEISPLWPQILKGEL